MRGRGGLILGALASVLQAQVSGPAPVLEYPWQGGRLQAPASLGAMMKGQTPVATVMGKSGAAWEIRMPQDTWDLHAFEDVLYCTSVRADGGLSRLYASRSGGSWEVEATWERRDLPISRVRALGGGRYLVWHATTPFREGQDWSWFAVARVDREGRLKRDHLLDVTLPGAPPAGGSAGLASVNVPNSGYGFQVLPVEGGWAAVHMDLGQVFIFQTEAGRVRQRRFELCPGLAEARLEKMRHPFLLGVYRRPNGGLLFAARSLEAVIDEGVAVAPPAQGWRSQEAQVDGKTFRAQGVAHKEASLKAHPKVHYWEADPPFRGVVRALAPEGAPERLDTLADLKKLAFTLDDQGRVRR